MSMFYITIEKNPNGTGKPIEVQVQRKPWHLVSDMIRKNSKAIWCDWRCIFDVLYIYTWRIIDHLHVNVHVKNIYKTLNFEIKFVQLIMHR